MLPSKYRLKKRRDFERVYKKGKGFKENFLFLKIAENDLENPRVGIVVGKKVSSKATERNLIKRRLREATKKKLPEMRPNSDIIIAGLEGLDKEKSFQEIEQTLERLLEKAGAIKREGLAD